MNNKIHDAVDSVHAEESLKRNTKAFLAERTTAASRPSRFRRMATALACFTLVLLGFGGWRFYVTPVSAISVDINPSIELGVNRFDRIVSVTGYNEDGTDHAASVELRNLNYSDALDALLSSEEMQPYRENGGLVSITVIGSTEQKSEEMRVRIASCGYASSRNVECQCGNREDVTAAHEAGLSFGKYRAFLELQALDPDVSAEDVQSMTMRQIRDRINELSGSSNTTQYGSGSGLSGSGYGGGGSGNGGNGGGQHRGGN